MKLSQLQAMSGRKGRVNSAQVRAKSTDDVAAVEKRVDASLAGASVTTASDLADRVGGSLHDAKSLSGKLGTALTIVGLAAAFLIASLLTLSSVTRRIRELGTLKAIGWPGRHVVRQVTGESVAPDALEDVVDCGDDHAGRQEEHEDCGEQDVERARVIRAHPVCGIVPHAGFTSWLMKLRMSLSSWMTSLSVSCSR